MSTPSQSNYSGPRSDGPREPADASDHLLPPHDSPTDLPFDDFDDGVAGDVSDVDLEKTERAQRRKRHVRLFCFSCNRYEGHSIAARSRWLYSFLVGFTFSLYYFLGRYSCHCCGSVRLARRDWLNPRFWYRSMWLGGMAKSKKANSKTKSRR